MLPDDIELMLRMAPVLATDTMLIEMILGMTRAAELAVLLSMRVLVTVLPISCRLHEERNCVTLTLSGG